MKDAGGSPGSAGVRLETIDALRGAAALAVVCHHVFTTYVAGSSLGALEPVFWLGSTGVWLFIVISGFCIHLRFAKDLSEGQIAPPAFIPFWKRRLRRLYPAYFAALLLYAAIRLFDGSLTFDDRFLYNFSVHVLLVHNLDPTTVFGFCGVFWTLALEEHLYLAYFPLVGIRRRWGWTAVLAACLGARGAGLILHWIIKDRFGWESPFQALFVAQWFVWALGALSVEAHMGVVTLPAWCRNRGVALGLLGMIALLITTEREGGWPTLLSRAWWAVRDPMLGLGFFVLINSLLRPPRASSRQVQFLARLLAGLGVFSYSLYLIHQAVQLHLIPMSLAAMGLAPQAWMAIPVVLACILAARFFFHLFERPFLTASRKEHRGSIPEPA